MTQTPLPEVARAGFEPNQAGLEAFNSIHNRKAFNLYADKNESWYVVYIPLYGIHPGHGFGSEANRIVRLAIQKGRAQTEAWLDAAFDGYDGCPTAQDDLREHGLTKEGRAQ
jgi:hypothetical protein